MMVPINMWAILVCGVEAVVLGMLWYGPLFGKPWRKEMGVTDEQVAGMKNNKEAQGKMMRSAAIAFIGALVTAFVLQQIIATTGAIGVFGGLMAAKWVWLGFAVPVLLGAVLWESKTWKWWFITIGYYLVSWLIMGAILGAWMTPAG